MNLSTSVDARESFKAAFTEDVGGKLLGISIPRNNHGEENFVPRIFRRRRSRPKFRAYGRADVTFINMARLCVVIILYAPKMEILIFLPLLEKLPKVYGTFTHATNAFFCDDKLRHIANIAHSFLSSRRWESEAR